MANLLHQKHLTLLDKKATKKQTYFYSRFPEYRGVSDRSLDAELLEAVLIAALTFGTYDDRVCVFAPIVHESWVLDQFNQIAGIIFGTCYKAPDKVKVAEGYKRMFKKILLAGKFLQLPEEPSHWVSFGFAVDDPIPEWMQKRLLLDV
jgi:hypothetical protein